MYTVWRRRNLINFAWVSGRLWRLAVDSALHVNKGQWKKNKCTSLTLSCTATYCPSWSHWASWSTVCGSSCSADLDSGPFKSTSKFSKQNNTKILVRISDNQNIIWLALLGFCLAIACFYVTSTLSWCLCSTPLLMSNNLHVFCWPAAEQHFSK